MKQFALPNSRWTGEGTRLEIRANVYNAFNKLNLQPFVFGSTSTVLSYSNMTTPGGQVVPVANPQFGIATGALAGRVVELEGKLSF
jgi:hypothetical protein